jgi:hypothetical protein
VSATNLSRAILSIRNSLEAPLPTPSTPHWPRILALQRQPRSNSGSISGGSGPHHLSSPTIPPSWPQIQTLQRLPDGSISGVSEPHHLPTPPSTQSIDSPHHHHHHPLLEDGGDEETYIAPPTQALGDEGGEGTSAPPDQAFEHGGVEGTNNNVDTIISSAQGSQARGMDPDPRQGVWIQNSPVDSTLPSTSSTHSSLPPPPPSLPPPPPPPPSTLPHFCPTPPRSPLHILRISLSHDSPPPASSQFQIQDPDLDLDSPGGEEVEAASAGAKELVGALLSRWGIPHKRIPSHALLLHGAEKSSLPSFR